ncbi:MAG: hypothetical protein ACXVJD_08900 [Mucilaginibacter sp.]
MKYQFFSLLVFVLFTATIANAQTANPWRIGFGVDAGVPASGAFRYALGGDIRLQKDINQQLSVTLTTGFSHFFEKEHFANYLQYGSPYNVIPVKAGIKAFLTDNFYVGAEAGVGFGFEQWGNSFVYSPAAGLAFKNGLDISIKYEDYTTDRNTRDIALRFAYGIDLRKKASREKRERVSGWQLGFSINPGVTTNSFDDKTLEVEVDLAKQLTNTLEFSFSAGVSHFFTPYRSYYYYNTAMWNSIQFFNVERNVIPVKAGLRWYAGSRLYVAGEAGAAFGLNGATSFVYSPTIGLAYKSGLDIGVKYENYGDNAISDVVSLKLGYRFKLK